MLYTIYDKFKLPKTLACNFGFLRRLFGTDMAKSKYEYTKDFETENKCLLNCWIVVRVDGKGFHKFSDVHMFEKPNDKRGLDLMTRAAASVFEELHDICFGFGHSDEFSFVFRKNTLMYNRRHDKLLSLVISKFSAAYVFHWADYFGVLKLEYPPAFDARVILFPTDLNLRDYLSWRQADVHVNNLHNTAFWNLILKKNFSTKEADERLKGTLAAEKNELLFSEFNINYNNEPEQFKKGTSLVRKVLKNSGKRKDSLVAVPLYCDIISEKFWRENPEILECKPAGEILDIANIPTISITPRKYTN